MKFFFFLFIVGIVINALGTAKRAKPGANSQKPKSQKPKSRSSGTNWENYNPEDHGAGSSIETLYKARDKAQALNTTAARAAAMKLLYSGLPQSKSPQSKSKTQKNPQIKKGRSFEVTNRQAHERGPLVRDMNKQRVRGLSSARKASGISASSVIGAIAVAAIGLYMARNFS